MPQEEGEYSCPICGEEDQRMYYNDDRKTLEDHLQMEHSHKTLAREFIILFEDYEEVAQELDDLKGQMKGPTSTKYIDDV